MACDRLAPRLLKDVCLMYQNHSTIARPISTTRPAVVGAWARSSLIPYLAPVVLCR